MNDYDPASDPATSITPLVLPSLAEFDDLTIAARTALFTRWVSQQPPNLSYRFTSITHCPVAQFGRAISGDQSCIAGSTFFHTLGGVRHVVLIDKHGDNEPLSQVIRADTFGKLNARFRRIAAIAHYGWVGYHARRLLRLPILPGVL